MEETRWLLKLSDKFDFIKGVVGWVDLCSHELESQLEEVAGNHKLVGVRHVVHDESDDRFMARSDFQNGLPMLPEYNLTYDLLIFPKHLALATELVSLFPDQVFILDHIAKPGIKDGIRSPWDKEIHLLAEHPNVYCKLSGMVTEANWQEWQPDDFRYYLDVVFEAFGADKLMIGSDWPVCMLAGAYNKVMALVLNYLAQYDNKIQQKILGMNCASAYRII